MILTPTYSNRDFTARSQPNGIEQAVTAMSWAALGGCDRATIKAVIPGKGKGLPLWALVNMLRCPVLIQDKTRAVWWGYIHDVTIRTGGRELTASLSEMYNSVRVAYSPYVTKIGTALSLQTSVNHLHDTGAGLSGLATGSRITISGSGASNDGVYTVFTAGTGAVGSPVVLWPPAVPADESANAALAVASEFGARATTAATTDADSVALFGTKDLLASTGGMDATSALQRRDTLLAMHKRAQGTRQAWGKALTDFNTTDFSTSAEIHCRGWFSTLDWRYAAVTAAAADTDTTAQISDIATDYGQFISAVDLDTTSGVTLPVYRNGETTAHDEITTMLETGTTNDRRLLADVTDARRLHVWEEPANTVVSYYQRQDGTVLTKNELVAMPGPGIAGTWCRDKESIPLMVDLDNLTDPSLYFIEHADWSSSSGLSITPRGAKSIYDILRAK
jgi:hypothetical protein